MIVKIDNISGNVKAITGKENVRPTYALDLSWTVVSLMNFKMRYTSILFFHTDL